MELNPCRLCGTTPESVFVFETVMRDGTTQYEALVTCDVCGRIGVREYSCGTGEPERNRFEAARHASETWNRRNKEVPADE